MIGYGNAEEDYEGLTTVEALLDPGTTKILSAIGVGSGMRCLEVGAGAGSIARWLVERACPQGEVVATDVDTRHLSRRSHPGIRVLQHDITIDDLPDRYFDLVHARLVLSYLADRTEVLKRLATACRPGGWVVVEDLDWQGTAGPHTAVHPARLSSLWVTLVAAVLRYLTMTGYDNLYGRRLHGAMLATCLTDVDAAGRTRLARGGTRGARFYRHLVRRLSGGLVAAGLVSEQEIHDGLAALDDPEFAVLLPVTVAAWGRRPQAATSS